jgi:glutathione peroxidase
LTLKQVQGDITKMKTLLLSIIIGFLGCSRIANTYYNNITSQTMADPVNIYDIKVKDINGKDVALSDYEGKVLLIVNVATYCGNTPQYEGLETIYEKYNAQGFEVLAFPCNDFGGQEPGSNDEIKTFCAGKYKITFPLFDKIAVLGENKNPLYAKLTQFPKTMDVSWNFEKFLVDKNGNVVGRFAHKTKPENEVIVSAIETELKK